MLNTKYLLIGASHASLSAIEGIRMKDESGPILMVGSEGKLPYSPTILPYIITGKKNPLKAYLRDVSTLEKDRVTYISGDPVVRLDSAASKAYLSSGIEISYEKALIGTGAYPLVPHIPGIEQCSYEVLRTMDHALKIRNQALQAKSAIIIGAGLVGMHLAEALNYIGVKVTVVEALPNILGTYFDERSSQMIKKTFEERGVRILTGSNIVKAASGENGSALSLGNGLDLSANLLIVSTGVKPRTEILDDKLKADKGIIVDDFMRTNIDNIWAAGDVVQCKDFFSEDLTLNAILPNAVIQGLIAGRYMAGDDVKPYIGAIPMNSYTFFGNKAFSIGNVNFNEYNSDVDIHVASSTKTLFYQKFIFKNGKLVGAIGINSQLDPGILLRIIRDRIPMEDWISIFGISPVDACRSMMFSMWR